MTAFMPDPSDYIQLVDLSLSIRLSTVDSGTGRAGFDVGSSYLLTGDHFKSPNKITGSYSPPGNGRGKDANLPISILTRINEIQSSFAAAQPGSDLRAAEGRFFFFPFASEQTQYRTPAVLVRWSTTSARIVPPTLSSETERHQRLQHLYPFRLPLFVKHNTSMRV